MASSPHIYTVKQYKCIQRTREKKKQLLCSRRRVDFTPVTIATTTELQITNYIFSSKKQFTNRPKERIIKKMIPDNYNSSNTWSKQPWINLFSSQTQFTNEPNDRKSIYNNMEINRDITCVGETSKQKGMAKTLETTIKPTVTSPDLLAQHPSQYRPENIFTILEFWKSSTEFFIRRWPTSRPNLWPNPFFPEEYINSCG